MVLHDLIALVAGTTPEWVPVAVFVILFVALALLWVSMNRHLKKAKQDAEASTPVARARERRPENRSDSGVA